MTSTSPAVGRALDVLLFLASRSQPVPVATLIRELDLPRSSTYHLLEVLVERSFVTRIAEENTYALGLSAFEIGSAYLRHEPLELLARPILKRLASATGETSHLGILHGAESLYLLKEHPPQRRAPVTLVTDVGVRLPAHLTANGRSMLAHLSDSQVRALFPSAGAFIRRTDKGIGSLRELHELLRVEKAKGWALEDGLITDGMQSVAACAFDHTGRPIAAFSVTRRANTDSPIERLARVTRRSADQLTQAVSGHPPEGWFAS